jgi:hypothetical protein
MPPQTSEWSSGQSGLTIARSMFDALGESGPAERSRQGVEELDADGCRFFGATRFCHLRNAAIFVLMRNCGTGGSRLVGH